MCVSSKGQKAEKSESPGSIRASPSQFCYRTRIRVQFSYILMPFGVGGMFIGLESQNFLLFFQ